MGSDTWQGRIQLQLDVCQQRFGRLVLRRLLHLRRVQSLLSKRLRADKPGRGRRKRRVSCAWFLTLKRYPSPFCWAWKPNPTCQRECV